MWVAKNTNWHSNASQLEKFAIERIIQRCDFSENISNKHRTSNGYTQLKELIHYCELSFRRSRTVKTLIMTLDEATSPYIAQNISSDLIIGNYFADLRTYITNFRQNDLLADRNQPNTIVLQRLTQGLKLFEKQLDQFYLRNLKDELNNIDYNEKKEIHRNAQFVSALIDLLIPYLIFQGYSLSSISAILRNWLKSGYHITMKKFLSFFHFTERSFTFLHYLGERSKESEDFLEMLKMELGSEVDVIREDILENEMIQTFGIPADGLYAKYTLKVLDPHMHVRSNFDQLIKKLVIQHERESLSIFNNFLDNSLWSNKPNHKLKGFKKIALDGDPINVKSRARTLRSTITKSASEHAYSFDVEENLPVVSLDQLRNSMYYYNLALCSKSIENSLSLLWTALESIHPFPVTASDIDAIQEFVSNGLSIGSFSRDIHSLALRFHQVNQQNNNSLRKVGAPLSKNIDTSQGLLEWYLWIKDSQRPDAIFTSIKKASELLAYQFHAVGKSIREEKQDFLYQRLKKSQQSIKFQLQRIYLHRNKIVHSGDMVNEYTNLWMHLEWYVGKILAYFLIQYHFEEYQEPLDSIYRELQGDQDYLVSYLEKNKEKKITELPRRLEELLFKHCWLAY